MNELIGPFVAEARELLESAGEDLLALERRPGDRERIESLFRHIHTLKGSAALLDLGPMTAATHAAEDLLAAIRAGRLGASRAVVDSCFELLDQVAAWVDAVERAGALPDEAAGRGAELAATLRAHLSPGAAAEAAPGTETVLPAWAEALASRHVDTLQAARDGPLCAFRYVPAPDCFLNGDDPLALVARVPRLLALDVAPREPWAPLPELDPFSANLVIEAVAAEPKAEIAAIFRLVSDQVEIVELPAPRARGGEPPGPIASAIIAEQRTLLAGDHPAAVRAATEASALAVVANALAHEGRHDALDRLRAAQAGGAAAGAAIEAALARPDAPAETAPDPHDPGAAVSRVLRVDVDRVDALAGLVSELAVARNALAHLAAESRTAGIPDSIGNPLRESDATVGRIAGELHRAVMQMRLVPLSGVFRRFGRPVREIAAQLGKEVRFTATGGETEADRTVADALFELLLHAVRNAVDHGIEAPEARLSAGKPREGRLALSAYAARDRVVVGIADDGRGIDPALLRRRAAERGLLPAERAAALTDEEAIALVFAPGFSTAAAVTGISGRGVGMDAVQTGAQRLGGRAEVESERGRGTTFRLLLPQTMMLTPLMTVRAGGETFGVPLEHIAELQRVPPGLILPVKSGHALAWRERTIPVVALADRLGLPPAGPPAGDLDLLVLRLGGEPVGLLVDGIGRRVEAVVRPLANVLAGLPGLAGTTVLGDGRVLLVLDLEEILA